MRPAVLLLPVLLCLALLSCGCTQQQAPPAPATPLPATPAPSPAPAAPEIPYPNASALKGEVPFGTGDMTGTATVTKAFVKTGYTWTSPSWRSSHQTRVYTEEGKVQTGYNSENPAPGNVFLFVTFRVTATGSKAVYAPSPDRVIVAGDRTTYWYRPLADTGVSIDGVSGSGYDLLFGTGGTGGIVKPGQSNAAEGYLIYEIPANLTLDRAYVLARLDYQTNGEWKLA